MEKYEFDKDGSEWLFLHKAYNCNGHGIKHFHKTKREAGNCKQAETGLTEENVEKLKKAKEVSDTRIKEYQEREKMLRAEVDLTDALTRQNVDVEKERELANIRVDERCRMNKLETEKKRALSEIEVKWITEREKMLRAEIDNSDAKIREQKAQVENERELSTIRDEEQRRMDKREIEKKKAWSDMQLKLIQKETTLVKDKEKMFRLALEYERFKDGVQTGSDEVYEAVEQEKGGLLCPMFRLR